MDRDDGSLSTQKGHLSKPEIGEGFPGSAQVTGRAQVPEVPEVPEDFPSGARCAEVTEVMVVFSGSANCM